ncbi:MAG TPA: hypothetical protein VH916_01285 [Dehalococcoidia bacterium]
MGTARQPPPSSMSDGAWRPEILLHVDQLVLDGFRTAATGDPERLGEALQRELTRLFAERGVGDRLARGGNDSALEVATIELPAEADAAAIGVQVARAVFRGLRA